jgi:hypothetical protein
MRARFTSIFLGPIVLFIAVIDSCSINYELLHTKYEFGFESSNYELKIRNEILVLVNR